MKPVSGELGKGGAHEPLSDPVFAALAKLAGALMILSRRYRYFGAASALTLLHSVDIVALTWHRIDVLA